MDPGFIRHAALVFGLVSAFSAASLAQGRLVWEHIRTAPLPPPDPTTPVIWHTYDLVFLSDSGAVSVLGVDMGDARTQGVHGLVVLGEVFNHFFGGSTPPHPGSFPALPSLSSTHLAFGDSLLAVEQSTVDLTGLSGRLFGQWAGLTPQHLSEGERMRLLRVTVRDGAWSLGGDGSRLDIVFDTGTLSFGVPQIPAPPTAAVAAMALWGFGGFGGLASRRRR